MRSEEEQYSDKWREEEKRQCAFGARLGIEPFRDGLNCATVYCQLLRGKAVGPFIQEKTLSLPIWELTLEGCTVKSDALYSIKSSLFKLFASPFICLG